MDKDITTLIYIERGDEILFLNRNKKSNDMNGGKYIGIGGHLERNECIIECLKREVVEETGVNLTSFIFLGIIRFINSCFPSEDIYLFTGTVDSFDLIDCDEGDLIWVKKEEILTLPLWEGDKYFLPYIIDKPDYQFMLTLNYDRYDLTKVFGPEKIVDFLDLNTKNPNY